VSSTYFRLPNNSTTRANLDFSYSTGRLLFCVQRSPQFALTPSSSPQASYVSSQTSAHEVIANFEGETVSRPPPPESKPTPSCLLQCKPDNFGLEGRSRLFVSRSTVPTIARHSRLWTRLRELYQSFCAPVGGRELVSRLPRASHQVRHDFRIDVCG
jgi:hypothetical protein